MKKIIIFTVAIIFMINTVVFAASLIISETKVLVLGKEEKFENDIYNDNGKIYVPVREFCEKLNIPIEWDEKNKSIKVEAANMVIRSDSTEEKDMIPDEETAINVARIILEKHMERKIENNMYELSASLDGDEWHVYLDFSKKSNSFSSHTPLICVYLSKITGAVKYISTYTTLNIDENFSDNEVVDFYGNIRKKLDISIFDFCGNSLTYEELKEKVGIPDCYKYIDNEGKYYQGYTLNDNRIVVFDYDYVGDDKIIQMWVGTDDLGYVNIDINKNIAHQLK